MELLHTLDVVGSEPGVVKQVAWGTGADGRPILATVSDGVRVWDVATGRVRHTLPMRLDADTHLALSTDPRGAPVLAVTTRNSYPLPAVLRTWNPFTGQPGVEVVGADSPGPLAAAVDADGRTVLAGTGGSVVWVWDAVTGEVRHRIEGHQSVALPLTIGDRVLEMPTFPRVRAVTFTPGARPLLVSGGDDGVRLWDPITAEPRGRLGHGHPVGQLAVAAAPGDGWRVVGGCTDGTIRVWDGASGTLVGQYPDARFGTPLVRALLVAPDRALLVSAADDAVLRIRDLRDGSVVQEVGPRRRAARDVSSVPGTPDVVFCWSLDVGTSTDGRTHVVTGDHDCIRVYDPGSGDVQAFVASSPPVTAVRFGPAGSSVAALACLGNDGVVRVFRVRSGALVATFPVAAGPATVLRCPVDGIVGDDGRWFLAFGCEDRVVRLFDVGAGALVREFAGARDEIRAVACGRDAGGAMVVAGASGRLVHVWDSATGALRQTVHSPGDVVSAVAMSGGPAGVDLLAVGDRDGWTEVSRLGTRGRVFAAQAGVPIAGLAFDGDSDGNPLLAVAAAGWTGPGRRDGWVQVFDVGAGRALWDAPAEQNVIANIAWGRLDRRRAVVMAGDDAVRVRDAVTGDLITELRHRDMDIVSVACGTDAAGAAVLATGGGHGRVLVWTARRDRSVTA